MTSRFKASSGESTFCGLGGVPFPAARKRAGSDNAAPTSARNLRRGKSPPPRLNEFLQSVVLDPECSAEISCSRFIVKSPSGIDLYLRPYRAAARGNESPGLKPRAESCFSLWEKTNVSANSAGFKHFSSCP